MSASRWKDCRRIRGGNALRNALRGRPAMQVLTSIITINEGKRFSVLRGKRETRVSSLISSINFDIVRFGIIVLDSIVNYAYICIILYTIGIML